MKNKRILIKSLSLLTLALLLISGCGKPGYLGDLAGKRLGVQLETGAGLQNTLNNALIDYISRRVEKLEMVGPQVFGEFKEDNNTFESLHKELGLDYFLLVKLSEVNADQTDRNFDLGKKRIDVQVKYLCTLTLTFRLIDLQNHKVLLVGQSNGSAEASRYIHIGKDRFDYNLDQVNQGKLIEQAMLNAVEKTKLL